MKNKPTEPGYYAWREFGDTTPNTELCRVFHDKDCLMVDFGVTDFRRSILEDCADREWFKVEGI